MVLRPAAIIRVAGLSYGLPSVRGRGPVDRSYGTCQGAFIVVTITERAAERVRHSAEVSEAHGIALRIQVRRRPDGGLAYQMGFDTPASADQTSVSAGVTVVMDPQSVPLAEGLVLDYEERPELPEGGEFVFLSPLDTAGDAHSE